MSYKLLILFYFSLRSIISQMIESDLKDCIIETTDAPVLICLDLQYSLQLKKIKLLFSQALLEKGKNINYINKNNNKVYNLNKQLIFDYNP